MAGVATRRSAFKRLGVSVPSARHAPLNSSSSDSNANKSGVILMVSVFIIPKNIPIYTGLSTHKFT